MRPDGAVAAMAEVATAAVGMAAVAEAIEDKWEGRAENRGSRK